MYKILYGALLISVCLVFIPKEFVELDGNIHVITYGNDKYRNTKERLRREAIETQWFNSVTLYGPRDLDERFKTKFKNVLNKRRGGGYWIWKAYIIRKKLEEIDEGDILVYLDAGCTINVAGKKRFNEYIKLLNGSDTGIISFQLTHIEKVWTTKEIFRYFNLDPNGNIANSKQISGTVLIMKKNRKVIDLMNVVLKTIKKTPLLTTDYYNDRQATYFKENRHDMSIFSVLQKMNNPILLSDEIYFKPFRTKTALKYPFWATRKRYI